MAGEMIVATTGSLKLGELLDEVVVLLAANALLDVLNLLAQHLFNGNFPVENNGCKPPSSNPTHQIPSPTFPTAKHPSLQSMLFHSYMPYSQTIIRSATMYC